MSSFFPRGFKKWLSPAIFFAVSFMWVSVAQAVEWYPSPRDFSLKQGQSKTVSYKMDRYGDTSPVSFQASGGSGITVSYSANPNTGNSGTLTFTASMNATITTQHVTVKAITPKQTNAQSFEIYVQKAPASAVTVSPTSLSFSATAGASVAAKTVNVKNSGTASLTINSLSLAGSNAALYNLNASACNGKTLAAGTSCSVSVGFNGSATAGTYAAQVNISSTASSNPSVALSATVTAPADFSMSASPASLSLSQGASSASTLSLTRTNNTKAISFSVSGLPAGVSGSFSANNTTGNSSILNLSASSTAAVGPATVTVQATDGTLTRTADLSINVLASTYSLSVAPVGLTIMQGQNASSVVSIARTNFTSAVNFSATAPAGVSVSFSPASTTGNSSTVNVVVANNTAPGPYIIGINAQGGSLTQTTPLSLVVDAAPSDFGFTTNPSSISINQGAAGAVSLNLSRNNYTDPVAFTVSGLPAGVTASLSANNTTGDSSVLNLTVDASAAVGTSTVTISAAGGSISHSASFSLNIAARPNYTLSTPAPLSIAQGSGASSSITITRTNFTNAVNFTAVAPAGISASFSPASTTGNSTTLNVSVGGSVTPAPYVVQIQANSGSITQNTSLALTVTATPPNFTMAVSPSTVSMRQNATATLTATFVRTNLTDSITPTISGLPQGVTGSCAATTGNSSACTLTAASDAAVGSATLSIQATAAGITRNASVSLTVSAPTTVLPAFPGALGFGAKATGGRGGQVIYVTNLNTSGPGSLQAALDTPGPKYILFKVSGVINGDVHFTGSDTTLAGQTAPGGGITVRGLYTDETSQDWCDQDPLCLSRAIKLDNFIGRFIRSRPSGNFDDACRFRSVSNVMIDHFSCQDAADEAVELSFSHDVTIQNTILGETIGGHSIYGGMLINYSEPDGNGNGILSEQDVDLPMDNLSIVYNNWNRAEGRFPEFSRESPRAHVIPLHAEVINNLMWDAGYFSDISEINPFTNQKLKYEMNWIGNHFFVRSNYPYGMYDMHRSRNDTRGDHIYLRDNTMNLYTDRWDQGLIYCCNDFQQTSPDMSKPTWMPNSPVTLNSVQPASYIDSRNDLREHIFKNAGAFPRDAMDQRLMNPICAGQIVQTARNVNPSNDAFVTLPAAAPPTDTDLDGMPDAWETAHGLNPNVQDHNGFDISSEGYTNLEVYLNELADRLVAQEPTTLGVQCN